MVPQAKRLLCYPYGLACKVNEAEEELLVLVVGGADGDFHASQVVDISAGSSVGERA